MTINLPDFKLQTKNKTDLSPTTQEYVAKRLAKIKKVISKINLVEIEVDKDKKGRYIVEVMIQAPGKSYRGTEISQSVEGSLDILLEGLLNQIKRDKTKTVALNLRGKRSLKKKISVAQEARFKK